MAGSLLTASAFNCLSQCTPAVLVTGPTVTQSSSFLSRGVRNHCHYPLRNGQAELAPVNGWTSS